MTCDIIGDIKLLIVDYFPHLPLSNHPSLLPFSSLLCLYSPHLYMKSRIIPIRPLKVIDSSDIPPLTDFEISCFKAATSSSFKGTPKLCSCKQFSSSSPNRPSWFKSKHRNILKNAILQAAVNSDLVVSNKGPTGKVTANSLS